jgi:hypothetical protein
VVFQGNPDDYDIDGYLTSRPSQVVWLVTRHASEIAPGDRVYLWRNQGQAKAVAGVIAETIVSEAPTLRGEDREGLAFWRETSERGTAPQIRAVLRLVRSASSREVLRRDWMLDDPILKDLPNLKMQAGTNYKLSTEQAGRLDALWSRTGRDWSRDCGFRGLRPGIPIERDHAVRSKAATCSDEGGRGVVAGMRSWVRFSWLRQDWRAAQ